jgi:hypothetical protein
MRFFPCDELFSALNDSPPAPPPGNNPYLATNFEQAPRRTHIASSYNGRLPAPSRPPLAQDKVLAIPRRRAPIPLCAQLSQTGVFLVTNARALQHRYTTDFNFHGHSPKPSASLNTETPKNFGFHGHSPKPSTSFRTSKLPHSLIKATPPPASITTPLPFYSPSVYSSSPQNQAPSSPSPALGRTGSIRSRSPFSFLTHGRASTEPADSKPKPKPKLKLRPKHNKLIKKANISEPTFVMVSPNTARAERAAMEAAAAELGLQLADAVAEIETSEEVGPIELLEPDANNKGYKQVKRWSRAPLLPDFDFSSTYSNSNPLFDSTAEEPITQDSKPQAESGETTTVVSDLRQAASQAHNAQRTTFAKASKPTYRCSIHAQNSASHLAVERACREIITEAGGHILGSYSFPGGFMFRIPPEIPSPIATCELPARGVKIELEKWSEFPLPNFDGLSLNPPSRTFNEEWLAVHSEAAQVKAAERLRVKGNAEKRVQTWTGALLAWEKANGKQGQGTPKRHSTVKGFFTGSKGATTENSHRCLSSSLETIRCGHEGGGAMENVSVTPRSAKHSHGNSEHRFTVVSDIADSDDESGGEEWESVRSGLEG